MIELCLVHSMAAAVGSPSVVAASFESFPGTETLS